MDYLIITFRTLFFYILITFLYRFMGKREIGQLGIIDLIISILIAELAAMCIDNRNESIFIFLVPIFLLVFIQIVTSIISLKNSKMRDLFDGVPSIIISRGKVNFKEMIKQRYNLDDLLSQLREQHIRNISEVDYAILESSGKLSVFKKINGMYGDYPMPLILDGVIQDDTLNHINKSKKWLNKKLSNYNLNLDKVFYAFFKSDYIYVIDRKNRIIKLI